MWGLVRWLVAIGAILFVIWTFAPEATTAWNSETLNQSGTIGQSPLQREIDRGVLPK